MTYCVGMRLNKGLVFMSDTRTNAGVDDISQVRKMRSWHVPGERVITLMSAGNLATTQGVVSLLDERLKAPGDRHPPILTAASMFEVATIIGETLRGIVMRYGAEGQNAESIFRASLIVGGQIRGGEPRLFLIYPEGNFIESGEDNPFFQIGETKYGRPMIVRSYHPAMAFEDAVKLLCVSFDSTIRANAGVDLPIDLKVHARDDFTTVRERRFERGDPYYQSVSDGWAAALGHALDTLPDFHF
ncbi:MULTISPECIES: peptidase [Sphingopyxis]|jgi:putative proteasome-type protease|uniref:20S proteasome n=1 Tax=Sphingopyxis granuli TaxID=267128 RepID=A0AA86GMW6_9SPHN|nr:MULTISPECIES: peptidase [Sphingopyxis]AMG75987.1 20S proteasome [Sphingopyxis granuli]APW73607.1 peptidase [Sphingopyxis granuli]AVA14753.1 peptidase [Sphingopyxis sp. MG]ODU27066.1 MAG: peptidase [Sphingopyxis sp. SCN 67-31]QUM73427.1 peptidase [Sphingopyxis granuli]